MRRPVIAAVVLALAVSAAGADDKVEPKSNEKIKKLQVELRDTLKRAMDGRKKEFQAGRTTLDSLLEISDKLLKAELALATKQEQRVAAWDAHLKIAKDVEEVAKARYNAALTSATDKELAAAARIEAEIGWLKAGGEQKKAKKDK